jgi:hypothetical protein
MSPREVPQPTNVKLVAFYLPQFHPIEINDRSHGAGFTEWTDVAAARPLYSGHHQPVQPGELGFYDLRDADIRGAQADLAALHGIDAFCYWHYWSLGERVMNLPFDEVLASGEPDFPVCLGWATHSWIDVRDPSRVLFEQRYGGVEDARLHFRAIEAALHDDRYLRVDGNPVVYLFRPLEIPDISEFTDTWRELASASGLRGLHIVGQERNSSPADQQRLNASLDAMVMVPLSASRRRPLRWRIEDRLRRGPYRYSYPDLAQGPVPLVSWATKSHPCVVTNWDNTPRWGRAGQVLVGSDPALLGRMVRGAVDIAARQPGDQPVFVKSWNEWAEGNYLEPDAECGRGRLEAVLAARSSSGR